MLLLLLPSLASLEHVLHAVVEQRISTGVCFEHDDAAVGFAVVLR